MKNARLYALTILTGLLAAGCAGPKVTYVEPDSSRLVTTVEGINIQDFAQAADAMTASLIDNLINPGRLKSSVPGEPALLAISRIVNNTSEQIDTDLLVKKIRVALLRTGKVQTSTTIAFGGAEDPLVKELGGPPRRMPDYTLSGKIIEVRARAGKVRQTSYVFQLSLSNMDGIAVWEDERTIVKQGTRPSVGF
ncbi:MAG: penicillin-binding protein activator LpoB [Verrucomicrobia bacterium]|nr:MAG: penicillin-binding protein activator LpoB [Verrucomicrobiota bacterium]